MAFLVTGANGFIGSQLCSTLAAQGNDVVAFCRRSPESSYLDHSRIHIFIGDVVDYESIRSAMRECQYCFHLAGIARQWTREPGEYDRVNVDGTVNVLKAAIDCKISRLVYTSTAGVFGPSGKSSISDEQSPLLNDARTDYEKSKQLADMSVRDYVKKRGLDACIVNPTRTFGPGPLSESNGLTRIMMQYEQGRWKAIPGAGTTIGNYVFIDDVISGHIKAMQKGQPGRRYVLGGENVSFNELFACIRRHAKNKYRLYHVPQSACIAFAWVQSGIAKRVGARPKITPAFMRRYFADYRFSSERAKTELDYQPLGLDEAVQRTMQWINANHI